MSFNKQWFTGPEYLYGPEAEWPTQKTFDSTDEELRAKFKYNFCGHHEIEPTVFSNWYRMVRTTAYILRFINNVKADNSTEQLKCPLLMKELRHAEINI